MAELFSSLFGMNMGGMRGGMNQPQRRAQRRAQKGADIRYKMKLPLVEALKGGTQKMGSDLTVKIPAGIKDGQVLRLRGKGQSGVNGGPKGDTKVEIEVLPHKNLRREGNTLHLDLPISLSEALDGAKVKVNMPAGAVQLSIPPGTNTGKKMRLKGKGVKGGDLVIRPVITLTADELAVKTDLIDGLPKTGGESLRKTLI
jgi:DnaJ-class molecular chaperone